MATSGSFDTNHRVSGKYNTYATFSWWQTGQSIDGNYTDISWSLVGKTASQHQNIYVYNVSVTVNGATTSKNFNGSMYNGTTLLTGTARIYHNNDGTKNFSASAGLAMYSSSSWYSGSGSWNLDSIPRKATIKSAPNFNDEENPTITYENKAGNSVNSLQACISLDGSKDDIAYRDISKTGTSYKFNLTEAERNVLRNATKTSNSRTVKFFVRTIIGGNTFYDSVDKTFSIVNANPVFSNYTFHDGNSTTTAITGNNQWIIQNKSSLVVDITSANKATAKKSATMASYVYEISSYSGSENYTTSDLSKTIGAINASQNQNLKVTAIDSRNNSTAVSKTVNIVPYATPVLNVSATRQNNFEANTTIKVSGSASLLKVNNVVKNTVNSTNGVQYRKKQSSTTTWGSWTNIPSSYNTSTGAVTVSDFIISLDNQQAWDFEFKLTDRLETKTVAISVSQGQPQFFIGADGRVSVGGLPSIALRSSNTGQLEVFGDVYAKNLRSAGNAWANGKRLAELPITSDKIDFTTVGGIKKLLTVPYTSFGTTESSAYYFDIRSAFCDYNSDRLFVYDAILIQLDFLSRADGDLIYLRWGPKDTPTYATYRKMFTLSNNSVNFQSADAPNLIFTSNNELQETLIITPVSFRSIIREKTTDEILNFAVSHCSGVQTSGQSYRLHFGSWVRLRYMPQEKVPMFFDSTRPDRGNMVVYGLRYPS